MRALLVVDMLNDFILDSGKLTNGRAGQDIVAFIEDKIKEYRQEENEIIYLCDNHEPDDREFENFPPHCISGSYGSQIIDELRPAKGDKIIKKRRYSGFFGTELDLYLREKGITEISIVGVCSNICVLYTTADARNLNYDVRIYKDGIASFNREAHEFALAEMEGTLGARII